MEIKQLLIWILGVIAAYILWSDIKWLSIGVVLLAMSYGVHPNEQNEYNVAGIYSNSTATRLMWTFIAVVSIFLYSLFILNK